MLKFFRQINNNTRQKDESTQKNEEYINDKDMDKYKILSHLKFFFKR